MPKLAVIFLPALLPLAACVSAGDDSDPELGVVTSAASTIDPECVDDDEPRTCTLTRYIASNICESAADTQCLEQFTVNICASGCPRYGWQWRSDGYAGFEPHMSNTYLRRLRSAAFEEPTATMPLLSFGRNNRDLLWHQTQAMLQAPNVRYYDGVTRKDVSTVRDSSKTVDPTRFTTVTWVNKGNLPEAMSQADMATWFQSIGVEWGARGDVANATYYLRLAERAFRAYSLRVADGGVRNNKTGYRCYNGFYCYWFHSGSVDGAATMETILNKNLHAIRDAMGSYTQLRAWREHGLERIDGGIQPLPPGLDPSHEAYLYDWARGGLFQLAYGVGARNDASAPPTLYELQYPAPWDTNPPFTGGHFAAYKFANGWPTNIKPGNTCHYHYHSMSLLSTIFQNIDDPDGYFYGDQELRNVRYKLLYGGGTRVYRSCAEIPSQSVANVPLARMYRAGHTLTLPLIRYCDGIPDNDPEIDEDGTEYDEALKWLLVQEPRPYYDTAYAGCTF